jgi:hypothetical protein
VSAKCFGCSVRAGTIPGTTFTLGDPVGCCLTCHALMCGGHGERDPGPPRFECVLCAPGLLGASAARLSGGAARTDDERAALDELARFGGHADRGGHDERGATGYRTLDDFVRRHPRYGADLLQQLRTTRWRASMSKPSDSALRRVVRRMSPTALELLGGAKVLVERLELPGDELSPTLRDALDAIERDDNQPEGWFR